MTDTDLIDLLIEQELNEMTSTGDIAVADAPKSIEDVEEDTEETDEEELEEINLEESKEILGIVLEESYKLENVDYPSFEEAIDIMKRSFGKSAPKKYMKVLESEYKTKTKSILNENRFKDGFERLLG
jgi:hypothetical protein